MIQEEQRKISIIYILNKEKEISQAEKGIRHKMIGKISGRANAIRKTFLVNNPSQAMRIKICVYPQNSFTHAI